MQLQEVNIDGASGLLAYFNSKGEMCSADQASLAKVVFDDGRRVFYQVSEKRELGDKPGHEFHGNQWTDGQGGSDGRDEFGNVEKGSIAEKEHQAWMDSLTGDEKEILEAYAGPNGIARPVNDYLRHGIDALGEDYTKEVVSTLDGILNKAHGTVEQTLYRGIWGKDAPNFRPGFTWTDKGFVSTTVNPGHALFFTDTGREDQVLLEIHTAKGAYIQDVVGSTVIEGETINEREWLLPRNLTYRVKSVNEYDTPAGKRKDIEVEILP